MIAATGTMPVANGARRTGAPQTDGFRRRIWNSRNQERSTVPGCSDARESVDGKRCATARRMEGGETILPYGSGR